MLVRNAEWLTESRKNQIIKNNELCYSTFYFFFLLSLSCLLLSYLGRDSCYLLHAMSYVDITMYPSIRPDVLHHRRRHHLEAPFSRIVSQQNY